VAPFYRRARQQSGSARSDAKPVAVRVDEVAFPSCEALFIDGSSELCRHSERAVIQTQALRLQAIGCEPAPMS
jgi:hypothetical protein